MTSLKRIKQLVTVLFALLTFGVLTGILGIEVTELFYNLDLIITIVVILWLTNIVFGKEFRDMQKMEGRLNEELNN